MMKRLMLLSTVAALGAFSAGAQVWAQDSNSNEPAPLPAPAEQVQPPAMEQAPAQEPSTDIPSSPSTGVPSTGAVGEIAPEAPVTPPPSDAIIPAQAADEVRADTLIGMSVYNPAGDKVGEVKDILLDDKGQVTGVVLSVGGVLGLGAKSVGLNWSEVDVQPEAEMVKVHYSKEQLEAAPAFKTQEAQQAESEQQTLQQQEPPAATSVVPPATPDASQPAPSTE